MKDVRAAGEVIAGDWVWNPESEDLIREAFSIANQWRDTHAYPMRSIRGSVRAHIRLQGLEGLTVARLKRMNAIRGKLKRMSGRRRPLGLEELQDLGGCRAIMNTMEGVRTLVDTMKARCRHELWNEDSYISAPRNTGYRSHHLKLAFEGRGEAAVHNGRRIEVQVRTSLQHSWATAVEAVGLFLDQPLKSGKGDPNWLRFFTLMSAEFAEAEKCELPPGVPNQRARMRELKDLNEQLGASDTLDNITHAVRYVEDAAIPTRSKPRYYLIRYDHETRQVEIRPQYQSSYAFSAYGEAEAPDNLSGGDTADIVLVEADKIENLPRAYPNYFGDVQLFRVQLGRLTKGKPVEEYQLALQARAIAKARETIDASWIGRRGMWTEPKRKKQG